MRYIHPDTEWPDLDPPLAVATAEEIAIAEEIRRALERKYLGNGSSHFDARLALDACEWDEPID